MVGNPVDGWWDVTPVQEQSSFADDAKAIAGGDAGDWTADYYTENDVSNPLHNKIVATWDSGTVSIIDRYGRAAQSYLRKSNEEFDSQW